MAKKGKGKGKKGKGKGKKGKRGDDDDESGKPQLLAGFSNAVNMKEVTLAMMEQQKQTERYENMRREHATMEAQMATNKKAMQTLEQTLDDNNEYLQGIIDEERLKNAKLRQEHGVVVAELEEHRRYHELSVEKLTEQFAAKQHKLEARIAEQDAKLTNVLALAINRRGGGGGGMAPKRQLRAAGREREEAINRRFAVCADAGACVPCAVLGSRSQLNLS